LLAARGERPVDGLDDVATLAERAHGRLEPLRECPHAWLGLLGQPIALEGLQAANAKRPIEVPADLAGVGPGIQHPLLCLRQNGAIDAREALGRDLGLELGPQLPVGLRAELERCPLLGPQAHPVGDVVLGDDEVLALVIAPADEDVAVGVAGVEVVDRDPIEPGVKILFHLPHHVAGEGAQVGEPIAILGGNDEAELVAIPTAAFGERLAIGRVGLGAVEPTALVVPGRPLALQVANMGVGRPAAHLQAHDARLDHDPAHPRVRATLGSHPLDPIRHRLSATDPRAPSLLGPRPCAAAPPLPAHLRERHRTTIGPGRRAHDLRQERLRPCACAGAAIAYAAGPWSEFEGVVVGHGRQIAPTIQSCKLEPVHLALQR
jgi:hypothetical protein